MKPLSFLMLFVLLDAASGPCVSLDNQSYCLAWSNSTSALDTYEYVRSGETVDDWKNLITLQRYNTSASFDEMMRAQDAQLRKSVKPHWFKPANPVHTNETATEVKLTDGSDTEYTLFYFFQDTGRRIESAIFSRHKPLASGEPPSRAQLDRWISQMRAMSPPPAHVASYTPQTRRTGTIPRAEAFPVVKGPR